MSNGNVIVTRDNNKLYVWKIDSKDNNNNNNNNSDSKRKNSNTSDTSSNVIHLSHQRTIKPSGDIRKLYLATVDREHVSVDVLRTLDDKDEEDEEEDPWLDDEEEEPTTREIYCLNTGKLVEINQKTSSKFTCFSDHFLLYIYVYLYIYICMYVMK